MGGNSKKAVTRRKSLKTIGSALGGGICLGLTSGITTAHEDCGNHWDSGSELTCYIMKFPEFDDIYASFKNWEHSLVTLEHDDWDGNITIRVGRVTQTDHSTIENIWENYYENGNGSTDLGDDRQIMLAGTFGYSEHNLWSWTNHIGRINSSRCANNHAAKKYWYHELGHAHTLGHRDTRGKMMNPDSWFGFSLNSDETEQWRDSYSYSVCSSTTQHQKNEQTNEGVTESELAKRDGQEIRLPTVVEKRSTPEEYRAEPLEISTNTH